MHADQPNKLLKNTVFQHPAKLSAMGIPAQTGIQEW